MERVLITEAVGEYMSIVWLFIAHEKRAEIYLFFYGGDSQTNQLVAHLHSVKQTSKQLWTPRDEMNKKKRWGLIYLEAIHHKYRHSLKCSHLTVVKIGRKKS